MAFLHVYIRMGSTRYCHTSYYHQQLDTKEKYTLRDMAFPCIYQENGIYAVLPLLYYQLVPQRRKYTPRDMAFLHVYIRMGSTRCCVVLGEVQGHGIPPCIYQNGIYGAATTSSYRLL
jgi:hypothetical protein